MDFYREFLFLMRYVDFSHVVWQCMVDCFVLFLVRMERIKRIGLVAAIRQKPGLTPVLWRTALQAEDRIEDYPGTPPPSVYQVTHGTALQAAECSVRQRMMVLPSRHVGALCDCV